VAFLHEWEVLILGKLSLLKHGSIPFEVLSIAYHKRVHKAMILPLLFQSDVLGA
jgi:hypothetical protein